MGLGPQHLLDSVVAVPLHLVQATIAAGHYFTVPNGHTVFLGTFSNVTHTDLTVRYDKQVLLPPAFARQYERMECFAPSSANPSPTAQNQFFIQSPSAPAGNNKFVLHFGRYAPQNLHCK